MAERRTGHSSWRAMIVVTASGGGWKDLKCAIPARTCTVLIAPMAVMKTVAAINMRIIRFFMTDKPPPSSNSCGCRNVAGRRVVEDDAAPREQSSFGAVELRLRLAVVGQRRGLGDPGGGQIVLAGQNQKVRREARLEALLFRGELRLGGGARGSGRFDALLGGLQSEDRVANLRADLLLGGGDPERRLHGARFRGHQVRLRGPISQGKREDETRRGVRKMVLADGA